MKMRGAEAKADMLPLLLFMLYDLPVVREPGSEFAAIKRVYVAELTGGAPAAHMRDLIIASLQRSRLFVLTENEDRADAILRGAADEDVYTETHALDDSVSIRASASKGRGSTRTGRDTDAGGVSVSERESSRTQERMREAVATVRLVLKNGDVVWSTTQESSGAKFRGASADVAGKIARQLTLDIEKARRPASRIDPPK
jgi:hypothetical protein